MSLREEAIASLSGLGSERAATRVWTIKEAAAKALGLDLFQAIREVDVVRVVLIWCSAGTAGLLKGLRIRQARDLSVSAVLIGVLMIYPFAGAWRALRDLPQARTTPGRGEVVVRFIDKQLREDDLILAPSPQNAIIWYYGRLRGIPDYHFDLEHPYQRIFLLTWPVKGQHTADILDRYGLAASEWTPPRLLRDFQGLQVFLLEKR